MFIRSFVDGHLGCCHLLAIKHSAATSRHVYVLLSTCSQFSQAYGQEWNYRDHCALHWVACPHFETSSLVCWRKKCPNLYRIFIIRVYLSQTDDICLGARSRVFLWWPFLINFPFAYLFTSLDIIVPIQEFKLKYSVILVLENKNSSISKFKLAILHIQCISKISIVLTLLMPGK